VHIDTIGVISEFDTVVTFSTTTAAADDDDLL